MALTNPPAVFRPAISSFLQMVMEPDFMAIWVYVLNQNLKECIEGGLLVLRHGLVASGSYYKFVQFDGLTLWQTKKSLFGRIYDNISMYRYIVVRARVGPPPSIRDAWYMNLRTANMSPTHVWQHRLFFRSQGEELETLVVCIILISSLWF